MYLFVFYLCSIGIESVINENEDASAGLHSDGMCHACEMAVVWMQNQLRLNQTQESILNYINEVRLFWTICYFHFLVIYFTCVLNYLQLCERLPSPMGESSVDCASVASMPSVSFTIGDKTFELKPEQVWSCS